MKRSFRFLSLLLAVLMIASLIAACSNEDTGDEGTSQNGEQTTDGQTTALGYLNETGLPIVKEPITLKIMVQKKPLDADWNEMLMWKEMEKSTGVHVEWELPANPVERKNIVLASGDYPDAFYGIVTKEDVLMYGSEGVFPQLDQLIDKYAPNFKSLMGQNPNIKKQITGTDGHIYTLPSLRDVVDGWAFFINQKWLDNLNMDMPVTTDDLYNVLKAFKENDPNGNGEKDEIPFTLASNIERLCWAFRGSWGLGNKAFSSKFLDEDPETGNIRFIPTDPKYKEMLQYLNKLYTEGLIDPNVLQGAKIPEIVGNVNNDLIGLVDSYSLPVVVPASKESEWKGIPYQFKGPYGDQLWSNTQGEAGIHVFNYPFFTITDANKYPEATMRWIDYLYSDEGAKLFMMGVEGETYYVDDEGVYRYKEGVIYNHPEGITPEEALGKFMPEHGIAPFWSKKYYADNPRNKSVETKNVFEALAKPENLPDERWAYVPFTKEENDKLIPIVNDITTYINEMTAQFIVGKVSFDQWDNYVNQIKQMKLDDYLNIFQTALDRYEKN